MLIAHIIAMLLGIYGLCIVAWLILTTLVSFNVVNRSQKLVMLSTYYLNRLCGPPLRQIRRRMPDTGQLDLSPIVLLLLLTFAQELVLILGAGQNPLFAVVNFIGSLVQIYIYCLIGQIILSLLMLFNIVNRNQRLVYAIGYALEQITEPALAPIRRVLPPAGGIDLSPMLLIFVLGFARNAMYQLLFHM